MMKLYSYSGVSFKIVESKWALARSAAVGIFLGVLLLLAVVVVNQSVADAIGAHSTNALIAENEILRQQLNLIAPRVNNLEIQAERLKERAKGLHKLLQRHKSARDSVLSFTNATNALRIHSLVAAAKSPRP
jgi:hypothetical protein